MDKGNTHIEYSGTDILNYFAGKLDAAEMHAMEKAALDDSFLAEAMEGYSSLPAEEIKRRLVALQEKVAGQETGKVVYLDRQLKARNWKAAAAILIITTGLAITYLFTSKHNDATTPTIAKVEKSAPVKNEDQPAVQDSILAAGNPNDMALKQTPTPPAIPKNETLQADSEFIYRPAKPAVEKPDKVSGGGYIADAETKREEAARANNQEAYTLSNAARNAAPASQPAQETSRSEIAAIQATTPVRFNGQVLAADNTPLPFANVKVAGENVGTYADANGNFRLVSNDSILQVEIKSAGYISRNLSLKVDEMPNKIFLIPDDIALKDKTVISGKASSINRTRRAVLQADTVMDARPADGWQNYDTYVTNNLDIPTSINQQKIHGEVEVSFDVLNTGAVTNLKIDKSLCNDCDEAVLRLIKDGPKWKISSGRSAKGKLKVKF